MLNGINIDKVMASCIIFNWARLYIFEPMVLAGIMKIYSIRAIHQLIRIIILIIYFLLVDCLKILNYTTN
jgi:hypothetical protein